MAFKVGQKVKIADVNKTKNDALIEEQGQRILEASNYTGEITKIENGIHFVGFKNEHGWLTQGFKSSEIKGVE